MKRRIGAIVFWGALWGLTEATLGYFLHMLPVNPGWALWFPIAFFFMKGARSSTGSNEAILPTAILAASIKFVDIFMPGSVDRVVNPAASILLEALCVYGLFKFILRDGKPVIAQYAGVLSASFLWRVLYIGYVSLLPGWMVRISPLSGLQPLLHFLLLESVVNGLAICIILAISRKVFAGTARLPENSGGKRKPLRALASALPYCLLTLALVIQRIL